MSQRSGSMDSQDNIRKRVCKACDRCRLKKSKCDGASPCGRCKADNAICVFGERKKSQDKVYPKGYVEMLEQQQAQLVAGIQKLYGLSVSGQTWPGAPLETHGGNPLTHDILERLDLLHSSTDGNYESFEEDVGRMQQKLIEGGAPYTRRRGSTSSDSEHGHTPPSLSPYSGTPTTTTPSPCHETFSQQNAPLTPRMDSPLMENPFAQSRIVPPIKQEAPAPAMFSSNGTPDLDVAMLSQNNWMSDPMVMDEQLTFNNFNVYGNYDQNAMMIGNDPIMPAWIPNNELEFGSYLNNS